MLKQTVLNAAHRALGARMVDFGGWDMPVNYGSQIEEHHAVRRAWGIFDVSHMCPVDVGGPDSSKFLSRLIANDIAKLKTPGKALYSAMLNDAGGVVDDLIVYWRGGQDYRIVVNAGTADKDIAWMQTHLAAWGLQTTLAPRRDFAMIAAQGPLAREQVAALLGNDEKLLALAPFFATDLPGTTFGDLFVARTGYTGEDGFEIMVPTEQATALWNALVAAGAAPCGLGARDTLRLEAGMNLYGQDMDDNVSPLDAGLSWTVAMADERDFVGRAALTSDGQKMQFLGLVLLDKGVLRGHQKAVCPQGAGEITSGSFSPTLQKSIALARLPLGVQVGDKVEVEIRDKRLLAQVVKPVFARNGKALI